MTTPQPTRILYMEDDAGAAHLFKKKLQLLGYQVDVAENGERGLAMYDAKHYDVVVTDQSMPVYDGLQVIQFLAQRTPTLPMLMITGAGNEKVAIQAMKSGAGDYIVKDIDGGYLELIPSVIEQLLEQRRLVREREEALRALETRNYHLTLLNRLGQALTATLNAAQIIKQLLKAAVEITEARGSSLWLWTDEQQTWLTCQAAYCQGEYFSSVNLSVPSTQGLVGCVAQDLQSNFADAVHESITLYPETNVYLCLTVHSLLAVPLRVRGALIGVLEVANGDEGAFDDSKERLLETLAASAAIAIDNAGMVKELRQQTIDLQMQNEDLDAFAHSVAHDLKNPIGLIVGYGQILLDNPGAFPKEQLTFLERILQGGRRMDNIINELLLLAEIRKVDVKLAPLDMATIVDEARFRLVDIIEEKQAQIAVPEAWPLVLGYAPWVEEVWVNYLSNALKYGSQPPEIELGSTLLKNGVVRLWIRNKGPELLPDERSRLFKPFTRLNQVHAKGHGLGLSIVRRIAEKLGGEVGVDNVAGYGPIFSFTLPLSESSEV